MPLEGLSVQIEFAERALNELAWFEKNDPKLARKVESLIAHMLEMPFTGLGKPEALKHRYSGCWSRRISDELRLVYRVEGEIIFILQCRFHYSQ